MKGDYKMCKEKPINVEVHKPYGVIITLPNNSKLDCSLNQEERERFEKCISAIKKACVEVGYKSLLEYLQIETNSDSTTNK